MKLRRSQLVKGMCVEGYTAHGNKLYTGIVKETRGWSHGFLIHQLTLTDRGRSILTSDHRTSGEVKIRQKWSGEWGAEYNLGYLMEGIMNWKQRLGE